ncbi:hypothetical protein AMTR_s00057p00218100 [Amborella trichopoda]|uniref:Uncharacterized protein n=2 Tax=Amborella trichopoda TaxID=13333 RepID=U5D3M8_AMBTC|nr:hypothetical protein AMTR_s00057p00218100 [Amborella trichopoda]
MNFGGSVVRVFTSMQEGAPTSMILGSVKAALLNGTIMTQIIVYGRQNSKKEKKLD